MAMNRRRFLSVTGLTIAGAVLAACGSNNGDSSSAQSSSSGAADSADATLTFASVAAGSQASIDPHGSLFSESDWFRLSCVYDQLLLSDDENLVPRLATKWTPNEDSTRWVFDLRDDAHFADGSPLTAQDVFYSLKRIDEMKEQNGVRLGTVDIQSSRIVDDFTIELATFEPDAELPRMLAGFILVVKDGTAEFDSPIASGPFVQDALEGTNAVLSPNEHWWGSDTRAQRVEINGFSDPQAMANAVSTGAVMVASSLAPAAAKSLEQQSGYTIRQRPGYETYPLLLRVDTAPFDKKEVRDAIKLALDREKLVEQVFLGYGSVGYDMIKHNDPSVPKDVTPIKRDVEKAKKLLAEAGHPDGLDLTLHSTQSYPGMMTTATVAAAQLEEAGIRVTIEEHAPDTYWSTAYTVEPFTVGMYTNTPFAVTVRQTVLSSSPFSETGFKNPQFDKDFADAMSIQDEKERNEALGKLHHRMAEEGGWVVWGFGSGLDCMAEGVSGWRDGSARYTLDGVETA
ncbi:Periplasmic oligopeptide-binding protein precursor [Corynebacterium ciconiae DSM 44920]|uniref:ABC transporter substrate-binding protein n=1 Tax=Corynebacterium ciconiae TaxID=227319 RepID=UPI0003A95B9F|nr:ABC transporter substrate-binding protein [Corynebacterium ciconiae]WKD61529.1 Periplasmic oligopeptide-binding protein precursor [Corynebacterium ciconiae DSM 44920]